MIFILGVMAAASRPSERCVAGLPMVAPYAAMNDLVRVAAFGVVSVLVILSLFIVELSDPEGVLLISNPLGSATPMGYFASYLNFSLVMLGVFWIIGLFSFILGFAGALGAAPPVARDPTIIVAIAVLVMVREVRGHGRHPPSSRKTEARMNTNSWFGTVACTVRAPALTTISLTAILSLLFCQRPHGM